MKITQSEIHKNLKEIFRKLNDLDEQAKFLLTQKEMYQKLCKHENWKREKSWICPDCLYTDPY